MNKMPGPSISELILEYFKRHPKQELKHGPVVDWVTNQWLRYHNEPPRDAWRAIRKLYQEGVLIKVKKGKYKYDPAYINKVGLWDFPTKVKTAILKRDQYRCVVCGRGKKDGVELVIDHIRPKDRGGGNDMSNGQVLCTEHNLLKKNYSQTEAGKRYFIKIYEKARVANDTKMLRFCNAVFDVYDEFGIDKQIPRPGKRGQ